MSEFLAKFRAENPAYDDMQDSDLVTALHGKFYSDIPIEQFNQKIGFQVAPIEAEQVTQTPQEPFAGVDQYKAEPMPTGYGQGSDIPINEPTEIDAFTGAAPKIGKSMGELVSEKMGAIGEGVLRAGQNVLPQFKSQLGGLMQAQENPLLTPSEFYMDEQRGTINGAPMQFKSYEDYTKAHEETAGIGSYIAQKGKELRESAKGEMKTSTAEKGSTEYYVEQGVSSILNMAPMLAVSIAGKRPDIGLGIMLAQVDGDAYGQGRDQGLSTQDAKAYATFQSVAEVIPSALPLGKMLSGSGVITQGLSEGAQEVVTAALQAGIDKGYINPEMTWGEAAERMKDAAIIGAGSGATMALATKPFAPKQDSYTDDPLKAVAVEMEKTAANNDINELASKAFDKATAKKITEQVASEEAAKALSPEQAQLEQTSNIEKIKTTSLWSQLTKEEQAKFQSVLEQKELAKATPTLEAKVDIKEQPIDKAQMPEQEAVAVDLPKEEVVEDVPSDKLPAEEAEPTAEIATKAEILEDAQPSIEQAETEAEPMAKPEVIAEIKKMPESIASGPMVFKPKPITGKLYRETNIEGITSLLRESLSNTPEQGAVTSLFVTDSPDLALGQKKNLGVKIQFDGDLVSGEKHIKPGTGIEGVTGNEFKTDYINKDAIESFTIPKGVKLKGVSNVFAKQQFNVAVNDDGSTTYTRKDLPKPAVETELSGKAREFPAVDLTEAKKDRETKAKEDKKYNAVDFEARVRGAANNFIGNFGPGNDLNPAVKDYVDTWLRTGKPLTRDQKKEIISKHNLPNEAVEALDMFDTNNGFGSELLKDPEGRSFIESKTEPAAAKKDTFTNYNARDSKGQPVEQSFVRGEYVKAVKSDKDKTFFKGGEIEGISKSKEKVKVNGVWHDFGSIVKAEKPEAYKPPTKKITEVIESANKRTGKGLTDADKIEPAKATYSAEPIQAYSDFRESVGSQKATAEEIKADAESLIKNKDKVIAAMSDRKFTKAMLQKITYSPRSDLSKPQMVKQAYQQMLSSHVMSNVTVTVFGGSQSFEDQIIEQVRNQTQADVDAAYEKQREYRADRIKQVEDFKKSLANPETLSEFKEFIRVRGKDKMTAPQLAAYDELVSESLKPEDKPVVVTGEAEAIKTERAQTTHSKTGADLFVVKMVGRVEKDKFRELNAKAKQFGGYYSSYSKGDAIPGFQFKTVDSADQFEQLLAGADVDKSDFAEAKAEVKQASNAQKLLDMADKMEEKATEEINRPRQANTAKRASMASSATERAEKQLALAKTVRNIGTRLQDGELNHLGKIGQVTQLEELISIQKRAIPNDLYEHGSFDGYSISRPLKQGVTVEDYIANVDFPKIELDKGIVESISKSLKGKRGYARLSADLKNLPTGKRDSLRVLNKEQSDKIMQASKDKILEAYSLSWLPDQVQTLNRLDKLGITTGEQLRAAIRELESMRVATKGPDPVKQLERALIGKKIEGFFPTPKTLVDQMIDYADIKAGHEVLEPSAGKGNIAAEIKSSAPDAILDVVEYNSSLRAILEAKGFNVVGDDFLKHTKNYDRIVMNPPFENFQDIDHVKHAYDLLKPGGKLVAIMGASVKNSRKKAVEFREWLDNAGSYIEDLPEGSFKSADRPTGVSTVMVTIEKNDSRTLEYKKRNVNTFVPRERDNHVFNAPGSNFIGLYRSTSLPTKKEVYYLDGRAIRIPKEVQHIEPIVREIINIVGRRVYSGRIKGKSSEGFYRPNVGEIRTGRKNDIEVLTHEMAHYLDFYSNSILPNFKKLYKTPKFKEEIAGLSYTDADESIELIEGFAEFTRLFITDANEAKLRAPNFYDEFKVLLNRDKKLAPKIYKLQSMAHKYFHQGSFNIANSKIGDTSTLYNKFQDWTFRRDSLIRQQMLDSYHAARIVDMELSGGLKDVSESSWKMFRTANGGTESITDHVLNFGTIGFTPNGEIEKTGEGLFSVLSPVETIQLKREHIGKDKLDLLLSYFVGRRALETHKQGRENLMSKEEAKSLARLGKDYPIFESIHSEYQKFNTRMLDFYEQAGLITPESRTAFSELNKDYVPFFRVRDKLSGGTGSGSSIRRLKGGTANINDVLENIQDGISANINAALQNKAKELLYKNIANNRDGALFAVKIATDSKKVTDAHQEIKEKVKKALAEAGIDPKNALDDNELFEFWQHGVKPTEDPITGNVIDSVLINGKREYYEVNDVVLQDMLLGLNPGSYGLLMNGAFSVKNLFTRSITLGVEFMGANIARDVVSATILTKNPILTFNGIKPSVNVKGYWPVISNLQGFHAYFSKNNLYQEFMLGGAGYSSMSHALTKKDGTRLRMGLEKKGLKDFPKRLFSVVDYIAGAFEYSTRIGEFAASRRNGKSLLESGFDAREVSTDYNVKGNSKLVMGYVRTVPFMNAALQSIDRTYREAMFTKKKGGNAMGFAMRGFLGITIPSIMLWLMNNDDDEYNKIHKSKRDLNWHFKIGSDLYLTVPKPYDVGLVFATLPENFMQYIKDENGKEFASSMGWAFVQMFGVGDVPAFAQGYWDILLNKKWTGAPVVPVALSKLSATNQFNANTRQTFVLLGKKLGVSPIKAQHMFEAYTGYLGSYIYNMTDNMLWDRDQFGEKPDKDWTEGSFAKRFFSRTNTPSTEHINKFFNLKEESDQIVADFRAGVGVSRSLIGMSQEKSFEDDSKYKFFGMSKEEKNVLFALNDSMNDITKLVYGQYGIRTQELAIARNKELTGKNKRDKLEVLWKTKSNLFMQYYDKASEALLKAKKLSEKRKLK